MLNTVQAPQVEIPLGVRLRLGRAAVQAVADDAGVDILHIKGDAVAPELRPVVRPGTDVDILTRPSHVARLDATLRARGWTVYSTFTYGSPFGHAQTYTHEQWGYLDLHRFFPGIEADPAKAFETLWSARIRHDVAGVDGAVPSVAAQAVILLLNDARSRRTADADALWQDVGDDRRAEITSLVAQLHAEVAFAAATGDLESQRGASSYALWKVITTGGSRAAEWRARVRAAPSPWQAVRIVARAPAVNIEHLEHRLGRHPTRREIVVAFFARPATAVAQLVAGLRARR